MVCSCILYFLVVLYICFDVNYFIRVVSTICFSRFFQKKLKVHDTGSIYGFCTTQDVDIFLRHMNNARYIRELDFARFSFYDRTGIYDAVCKLKGNALQGASNVRYRRTIPVFSIYRIDTKIIYWDETSLYLEQQFVTRDKFVRAAILSKQNIVGVNVIQMMESLGGKQPECPAELKHWIDSLSVLSDRLRKSN